MFLLQSASVESMHKVLENLYNEMIPLCSRLIGVAQLIAGLVHCFLSVIASGSILQMLNRLNFFHY